jgi:hypothetical protein
MIRLSELSLLISRPGQRKCIRILPTSPSKPCKQRGPAADARACHRGFDRAYGLVRSTSFGTNDRNVGATIGRRLKSHSVRSTFDSWRADAIDGSQQLRARCGQSIGVSHGGSERG